MKNRGIIAINKPAGWTSFDVVNKIKHMVKPLKVGHLGTLDPMATGVLLVTVGKATKLFDIMQQKLKTYVAEFEFGKLTDTLDATGETLKTEEVKTFSLDVLEKTIAKFIGKIQQVPPKYSAKSINGTRAYVMARNNVDFEIPAKIVVIESIEILSYQNNVLKLKIICGSGTYIRSIGRDIAESLGTIATMTSLIRTKIDSVIVENCTDISKIDKDNVLNYIVPINEVLNYQTLKLSDNEQFKILNGQVLELNMPDGIYKLNDELDTVALIKIDKFKAKMSLFLG